MLEIKNTLKFATRPNKTDKKAYHLNMDCAILSTSVQGLISENKI